jgi:site-specific DNA-methyltransferase (adenine-specific)
MKDISSNSIDLIICDLPYGCLTGGAGKEKAKRKAVSEGVIAGCAWDIPIDLDAFWKEIKRIRKDEHTPTIHFCTTKFGYELIQSNPSEFRYDLVWDKQRGVSFLTANKMPMRSHEMIYVFSKAGAFYNRVDKPVEAGRRCVKTIIQISTNLKKGQHPTEKPNELYNWLVERYCPPGGTVLDPTFGSGNSVFTAYALGRNAIGIEKDEKFYKKAVERL